MKKQWKYYVEQLFFKCPKIHKSLLDLVFWVVLWSKNSSWFYLQFICSGRELILWGKSPELWITREIYCAKLEFSFTIFRYCKNRNFFDFYCIETILSAKFHKWCQQQICFRPWIQILIGGFSFTAFFQNWTVNLTEKIFF